MKIHAKHILAKFEKCRTLGSLDEATKIIKNAVFESNMSLIDLIKWEGHNKGYSIIALVVESHFSIHVWVEEKLILIDVFTCGSHSDPWAGLKILEKYYKPQKVDVRYLERA
jgi:S-adenosylmethionine decarboxylase